MLLTALLLIPRVHLLAEETRSLSDLERKISAIYQQHFPVMLETSPDGAKLLLKDVRLEKFELSVMDLDSKQQVVIDLANDSQIGPRWSHDGTRVAFYVDERGDQRFRIKCANLRQRTVNVLGPEIQGLTKLSWSPDDKLFAYVSQVNGNRELMVTTTGPEAETRRIGALAREGEYAWSPDSQTIAYVDGSDPLSLRLVEVRQNGAKADKSIAFDGEITALNWSPDGSLLIAAVRPAAEDFPRLMAFDVRTRTQRKLKVPVEGDISGVNFGSLNSRFIYTQSQQAERKVLLVDLAKETQLDLTPQAGVAGVLGFVSRSNRVFIAESKRFGMSTELKEFSLDGRAVRLRHRATSGERSHIVSERLSPELAGGRRTQALLWRDERAPIGSRSLVIMVHGGPKLNYFQSWRPELDALLQLGVDVLQLNYSGSSGYGAAYAAQLPHAVDDVVGTAEFAVTLGYKQRGIFLMGDSFGAGLALQASGRLPDRIGGLILFSFLGSASGHGALPERTLVFHGANDPVASPAAALSGLQRFWRIDGGVEPTWWRIVNNEGHSFRRLQSWAAALAEVIKLIERPTAQ